MDAVLVTGGAGYIGSHAARALSASGSVPVALDNLQNGHESFVRWGPIVVADILDRGALDAVFQEYRPRAVLHFAGRIDAAESVAHPDWYFRTNVEGTRTLLQAMQANGVNSLVFSSSASVYGNGHGGPIAEETPVDPISPYGQSKDEAETAIRASERKFGLRSVSLRFFNAAGASVEDQLGEAHDPETHAIPLAIAAASNGTSFRIFGTDYGTPDGTAVRDFVHVRDLANAHVLALDYLDQGGETAAFNLGAGTGSSVRDVLSEVEAATGKQVKVIEEARRPGDAEHLVSDCSLAQERMGWRPQHSDLSEIIASAWRWHIDPHRAILND